MSDEEIIKCVQKGDAEAYAHLIERYKDQVFGLIYKYTNDYSETQDIAQEVFIKIYKQIHTFQFHSKISTWFYRIATNSCIDWDRKRQRNTRIVSLEGEEAVADERRNPEEQLLLEERKQAVREIVHKLPPKYKLLIVLYHFHGLKYKEISEILDIPVKTVETRLHRARRLIKKEMEVFHKGGEFL